ncbi:TetR/AcrR family transcriptional regulator [Shewanella fidelis]|uniref:TetR/AcrR family transcriptional regulator n=1 Tax=Shewanella fidelis TaxID=173509 RepID=A0AAW8NSL8_9GAMM|nr:TetR/AcrR family transcriptional regulator [Shewanella fidelis]MDR8525546.1 TetR/AcrR family transcriptional regulator [Shewanella fidelis]MDW4813135.1 TetR/AcrR family transcriptional regulator [Shewanella fidelis]MDW4816985.1 TetR/AcrR family transcriptional regulator [Shewanella fidelis]MDW4820144.1 TetR/AcrR family transcriptional regulator [Shewanella fidelis]MDW4825600.1 TetR/AcrR family transcriptional regulator [Shewanella fidelis]
MSNWQQRESYLTDIAERCLRGHKSFDLRRSHLVEASQISKGTIYNHFPTEADLVVAVATAHYKKRLERAYFDQSLYPDGLTRFLMHHCWGLRDDLLYDRFIISRVMPNPELLEQVTDENRMAFEQIYGAYIQWNNELIKAVGVVEGFDRAELVANYLRGAQINCDDAGKHYNDASMYYQFSYALSQLMGHSDKRIPNQLAYVSWLASQEDTANAA